MNLSVFSVFDAKIGAFMTPFFMRSRGEALRAFSDAVNKDDSTMGPHAEDFTLFLLGDWDDGSAKFVLKPTPESLGLAVEFVVHREKNGVKGGVS